MMHHTSAAKRPRFRFFGFFSDIFTELKKVVWLTKREAAYLTFLVLIVALIVGLVLGALDYGFTHLVDEIFLGG